MISGESDLDSYWHGVNRKMANFKKLDEVVLAFAARTSLGDHWGRIRQRCAQGNFSRQSEYVVPNVFE